MNLSIDAYIAAAVRTPLGGFNGSLASLSATKLGSIAIEGKKNRVFYGHSEDINIYLILRSCC